MATIAAGADPKKALENYAESQDELLGDGPDLSTEEGRKAEYERLLDSQNRVRDTLSQRAASSTPAAETP